MCRRVILVLALVAALPGQASPALASGATATTTADRVQPQVVFTYPGAVTVTDPPTQVTLNRAGSATQVPVTVSGSGTNVITVSVTGTLAAGATYSASVTPDLDTTDTVQWTTRAKPAHPTLHVKIVTALAPDAVADIAHRLDRANLLAVPRTADFVDISAAGLHALSAADLSGYQAALVVTDQDLYDQTAASSALSSFAAHGHGVVLAGQTHWPNSGLWAANSSIGSAGQSWQTTWSPLGYAAPPAIEGGTLNTTNMTSHFLTKGLTGFTVAGPGSGQQSTQYTWNEAVLANLHTTAAYATRGQSFIAIHREMDAQPGRVVDLGFDPWSTDIVSGGGGYDPGEATQAGALLARALWWATDRIPPTDTHFTSKPKSPTSFATVIFTMAAKDADGGSGLRYQYRLNSGRWKWASGGTSFALYHLPSGHTYTVRARAVDFAGNKDAHPCLYRFRVPAGATG
jgi:hypothetical protein